MSPLLETLSSSAQPVTESPTHSNFYLSFWVLTRAQRHAITTVYRWCRLVDDVVDDPTHHPNPRGELGWWHEELTRTLRRQPTHAVMRELAGVIDRYQIPEQYFRELLEGVAMDLDHQRYATFEALTPYCYRVAGTVGLMCMHIFTGGVTGRPPEDRLKDYAIQLGTAFQLTNILRDVRSDAARGRLYLPQEDLTRCGCPEADLLAGRCTPAVRHVLALTVERAQQAYAHVDTLVRPEDTRVVMAAELMKAVYQQLLERIAQDPCRVWRERVQLSLPVRCWCVVKRWFALRRRP